jgi:hypothetical protein
MAAEAPYYTYAANPGERYLYFFDFHCAAEYEFPLPEQGKFKITLIDPWDDDEDAGARNFQRQKQDCAERQTLHGCAD